MPPGACLLAVIPGAGGEAHEKKGLDVHVRYRVHLVVCAPPPLLSPQPPPHRYQNLPNRSRSSLQCPIFSGSCNTEAGAAPWSSQVLHP